VQQPRPAAAVEPAPEALVLAARATGGDPEAAARILELPGLGLSTQSQEALASLGETAAP
jgi:hypothetical protein